MGVVLLERWSGNQVAQAGPAQPVAVSLVDLDHLAVSYENNISVVLVLSLIHPQPIFFLALPFFCSYDILDLAFVYDAIFDAKVFPFPGMQDLFYVETFSIFCYIHL
jgi:hypothetical protein